MDKSIKPESITSIAKGTRVTADIKTDSDLRIAGMVEGDIKANGKLVLTESGRLTGTVVAQEAIIAGRFTGELRVFDQVIVKNTAVIDGFIFSKLISVEDGAEVTGIMSIGKNVDVLNAKISKNPKNPTVKKAVEKASKTLNKSSKNENKTPSPQVETSKPVPTRYICDVLIGIPQSNLKQEWANKIREACESMIAKLGFSLEIFDEPAFDPFFQKLTYVKKSSDTQQDIRAQYSSAKKSIETALLNKGETDHENELQPAADILIKTLQNVDEFVIVLGEIVLMKFTEDEVQTVAVELVTDHLKTELKNNPSLINDPKYLQQHL